MVGSLTIVGSGEQGIVEKTEGHYLFVNSAVLRSESDKVIDLMITDGLLDTDDELTKAENATGMDAYQSFEIRKSKKEALVRQKIGTLYVVSQKPRTEILSRLVCLKVDYQALKIITRQDVSKKMLSLCLQRIRFEKGFLRLIFWHLVGRFTTRRIPAKYRPSTGGVAILYARYITRDNSLTIKLDGIGNSDTEAYYPDKSGKLIARQFNNLHYSADQIILECIV